MSTLHGAGLSPFVRKVRIALKEKGIAYDHDPVVPFNVSDEFKKMSPLGKIPVYTPKAGVHIPDSSVIIAYLERTHPKPALYPENPEDFARALFLEEYGDGGVVPAAGPVFFQRIIGPRLMGQPTDEALVKDHLENKLPPLMKWLDEQIGNREYLVGNAFTVADIGVLSPFVNLMHAGEKVDAARYPNLARYLGKMFQRPSVEALIKEEQAFFKQAA
jgi:glutathione S-transferase